MCEKNYREDTAEEKIAKLEKQLENYRRIVHANANYEFDLKNRFFTVEENTFILDNSFDFDAGLKVSGDFIDNQKLEYAQMIARALNDYNRIKNENEEMKKILADLREHTSQLPKEITDLIQYLKN